MPFSLKPMVRETLDVSTYFSTRMPAGNSEDATRPANHDCSTVPEVVFTYARQVA